MIWLGLSDLCCTGTWRGWGRVCVCELSRLVCGFSIQYPGLPVPGETDTPQKQGLRSPFRDFIFGNLCASEIGCGLEHDFSSMIPNLIGQDQIDC